MKHIVTFRGKGSEIMVWNGKKTEQTGSPFSRPAGYYEAEAKKRIDKILQEAKAKKEEQMIGWNSSGLS